MEYVDRQAWLSLNTQCFNGTQSAGLDVNQQSLMSGKRTGLGPAGVSAPPEQWHASNMQTTQSFYPAPFFPTLRCEMQKEFPAVRVYQ